MSSSGRQQRSDQYTEQLFKMTAAVERLIENVSRLDEQVQRLARWAKDGSNGVGNRTAEARISKLENDREADARFEAKTAQRIGWIIALTGIVSGAVTGIILKLIT